MSAIMSIVRVIASLQDTRARKHFLKGVREHINLEASKYRPGAFVDVPIPERFIGQKGLLKVMRSRDYLVQIFDDNGYTRISVNCVQVKDDGNWLDGISWDTLMEIKAKVGYGEYDAVEVYPRDNDVVNVANIRHLFILKESLPFIWKTSQTNARPIAKSSD